jgi:hypothetical protein
MAGATRRTSYTRRMSDARAAGPTASIRTAAGRPVPARASAQPDDERWEPGMPVLDRQPVQAGGGGAHGAPPRSVPEARPTRLPRDWFVYLSVVAFLAGAVAITAIEFGVPLGSPLVKACVLVGAPPLAIALADGSVRIWRSAWAWMPVDRVKGIFRLTWLLVPAVGFIGIALAFVAVFSA